MMKNVTLVHGFNGIPDIDTLLPLCIDNCKVESFNYADRDKLKD